MVIKTILRNTIAALTLLTFLSFGAVSSPAASLNQLKNQHARLQQEIGSEQAAADNTAATAQKVQAKLDDVDASLGKARSHLLNIDTQEMQVAGALSGGEARLAQLNTELAGQTKQVDGVLRFIQADGSESYLSVLLGAHSFADFLSRMAYLRSLASYQLDILKEYHTKRASVAAQVASLDQKKSSLTALARTAASAAAAYNTQAGERRSLLAQLSNRHAVEKAMVRRLEQQNASLMQAIHQLEVAAENHQLTSGDIESIVTAVARQYGIDPALIWDIIRQESGGNASATSRAGAEGLMQLMPGTAAGLGVTDPMNPEQNIRGGVAYFASLLKEFHGNVALALAAYNAGPQAVKKYGGIPPYKETQNYVKKILGQYQKTVSGGKK